MHKLSWRWDKRNEEEFEQEAVINILDKTYSDQ